MAFWDGLFSGWFTTGTPTGAVQNGVSLSTESGDSALFRLMGINEGKVTVNETNVLGLSAVYACVDRISKSIGALPWDVLSQADERTSIKAKTHPAYKLLHNQPHPLYGSTTFRRLLVSHLLLKGNFYAEIQVDGRNRPIALKAWPAHEVGVYKNDDRLYYKLQDGRTLQDYQMIHLKGFSLDGLMGRSPIRVSMDTFKAALQTQQFGTSFYENSARPSGVLINKSPKSPSPDAKKNLKESWQEQYSGSANAGRTPTLTDGWEYQQIGVAPDEAQYLDTRKFSRTEICALFGVPPHMVMDLENATFSNIENQNIWYVTHTLMPIITNIEEEFNRKLFRESEQGIYYNKINVNGLLRGDTAAQTAHIQAMVDRGIYSRNEARAFLDMNPYDGGDEYLVQGAMAPANLLADFYQMKITQGDAKTPPTTPANG